MADDLLTDYRNRRSQDADFWNQTLANIGNLIYSIPERKARTEELQAQREERGEIREARGDERQLRAQQLAFQKAEFEQKVAEMRALDEAYAQPGGFEALIQRAPGHLRGKLTKDHAELEEANARRTKAKAEVKAATNASLVGALGKIKEYNYDPIASQGVISALKVFNQDEPEILKQLGMVEAAIRENPTAEHVKFIHDAVMSRMGPEKRVLAGPGTRLMGEQTGTLYGEVPPKPENLTPEEDYVKTYLEEKRLPRTIENLNAARKEYARSGGKLPSGMTPSQELSEVLRMRGAYQREVKAATTVNQQVANMRDAMKAVESGSAPAGSQAVITTFNKILEPTSVVYLAEFARSEQGQPLLSRLEGQWLRIKQGGTTVPPAELKKFLALAEDFAENQNAFARQSRDQINAIAERYELDPKLITLDPGEVNKPPTDVRLKKPATVAQVDAVAKEAGITYAEAKKLMEDRGYVVK